MQLPLPVLAYPQWLGRNRSKRAKLPVGLVEFLSNFTSLRARETPLLIPGDNSVTRGGIAPALDAMGLTLADIDLILNTHEHLDHTGEKCNVTFDNNAVSHNHDLGVFSFSQEEYRLTMSGNIIQNNGEFGVKVASGGYTSVR